MLERCGGAACSKGARHTQPHLNARTEPPPRQRQSTQTGGPDSETQVVSSSFGSELEPKGSPEATRRDNEKTEDAPGAYPSLNRNRRVPSPGKGGQGDTARRDIKHSKITRTKTLTESPQVVPPPFRSGLESLVQVLGLQVGRAGQNVKVIFH